LRNEPQRYTTRKPPCLDHFRKHKFHYAKVTPSSACCPKTAFSLQ
jgi:hypothetical protein